MFREMRRHGQQLPREECEAILEKATSGVLAVLGDEDYPYAVPMSYVWHQGRIWFHCAKSGHKLEAIRKHPKASFCVVSQDKVIPEQYTTHYRSVIAFGLVRELSGEEAMTAIRILAQKYAAGQAPETWEREIAQSKDRLCVLELEIQQLTGKEAVELSRERKG